METKYNLKSPAVKRIMREAQEMCFPTAEYFAQPLDDNLFEWHFTIRGAADSAFSDGIYHGRIILPPEYPMKPPNIVLLTPNGRFEVGKKVCLSISGYHPESWQPSWSVRTALVAMIGFMPTDGQGAIGALDYSAEERRRLARASQNWTCAQCGQISSLLLPDCAAKSGDATNGRGADTNSAGTSTGSGGSGVDSGGTSTSAAGGTVLLDGGNAEPATHIDKMTNTTIDNSVQEGPVHGTSSQHCQTSTTVVNQQRGVTGSFWTSDMLIVVLLAAIAAILCRHFFLLGPDSDTLSETWHNR